MDALTIQIAVNDASCGNNIDQFIHDLPDVNKIGQ